MEERDREKLVEMHTDIKWLKARYNEDIPPMKKLIMKHEVKITVITAIAALVWAATIAYFEGGWERIHRAEQPAIKGSIENDSLNDDDEDDTELAKKPSLIKAHNL